MTRSKSISDAVKVVARQSETWESVRPVGERLERHYLSLEEERELHPRAVSVSMLTALASLDRLVGDTCLFPDIEAPILPRQAENGKPSRGLVSHLMRVAAYARLLAGKYGMSELEADFVAHVAAMHDVGKWIIPEAILSKAGVLTQEEWEIMKTHTLAGYEMLKESKLHVLRMGAMAAEQHQEKFDGTGYPRGLKGGEIHIYSRITTVVDVFDALGSERPYKKAWAIEEIADYFRKGRGSHFDPILVDLLLDHLGEFLAIREKFSARRTPVKSAMRPTPAIAPPG